MIRLRIASGGVSLFKGFPRPEMLVDLTSPRPSADLAIRETGKMSARFWRSFAQSSGARAHEPSVVHLRGWNSMLPLTPSDGGDWVLFRLDNPAAYDGRSFERLLLRSRWKSQGIGDAQPTSVFILLVPDGRTASDGFDPNDFQHVAWGMALTT